MNPELFEARMRQGEVFHSLRVVPGAWIVIRVDGRGFSRLTESRFKKPFDEAFHACMLKAAGDLLEELHALYVYTESDEVSVLCPPAWDLFDREVEKIVSISAGIASAAFTQASAHPAHFDGRVWVGASRADAIDYFRWRQADATRCAMNGWCYWTLRQDGRSAEEATRTLRGATRGQLNEILFQRGINFNDLPAWQRRGTGLYWETYQKEGYNPLRQEKVLVDRRRVKIDQELPMKDDYSRFLWTLTEGAEIQRPGGEPDDAE